MIDRVGQRFGRLVVTSFAGVLPGWIKLWECRCDCGNAVTVRANNLTNGTTKSCGCLKMEILIQRSTKHGLTGGHGHYTRPYRIWLNIRRRCLSKKCQDWKFYGGRGITVCNEWDDYAVFFAWSMANGYEKHLTIERVENNKGYSPDNCKWATRKVQSNNRRSNHNIEFKGQVKTLQQWAEEIGMAYTAILGRINRGWPIEKALLTPINTNYLRSGPKNKAA